MYTLTMYSLLHCLEYTTVHLVLLLTSGVFLFFFGHAAGFQFLHQGLSLGHHSEVWNVNH